MKLSGLRLSAAALAIAFATVGAKASDGSKFVLSSYLVETQDEELLQRIADRFELTHPHGSAWEVYVPAHRAVEFLALAPTAELKEADTSATIHYLERQDPEWMAGYRTYAEVQATFRDLAARHPEILKLETIGETAPGKPILALKISDNVQDDEDEPELMLTAATHGDELITVEVLVRLVEELVAGYGKDPRLTALVDDKELWVIPAVNPDGFMARSRYAGGVDPNRDYPYPGSPERRSVKCIEIMRSFVAGRQFQGALDFHASGKMVMYPWAYTRDQTEPASELAFRNLGRTMAELNRYTVGQISRILYVAVGSSADYYHWKHGMLSYGIELATTKVPSTAQIPAVVTEAREMTWRFIEHF